MSIKQSFIKFKPILKEKIWGGRKLVSQLNKKSGSNKIGESWEVSDIEGDVSVVVNGPLKGASLKELITKYKSDFLGNCVYEKFGHKFPLLIKFIDAKEELSIQLHPDDNLAKKRHNSLGKTEMWYVIQADDKSNLIVGFKKDSNKTEYLKKLTNKSLLDILNVDEVTRGDAYFIPAGRIHAIGAGVMLAEIQQTSDITYRVYDWDRQDANGEYRALHTEEALEAIDYSAEDKYYIDYQKIVNKSSEIVSCPYFTTNILCINGELDNKNKVDSFKIYMCIKGKVIFSNEEYNEVLEYGETLLLPANVKEFNIRSTQKSELLEVYIS